MVNIYDSANQLAKDLQQTQEYENLKKAIADVQNDQESADLFKKMDALQTKILTAQQSGQPLAEEDQKAYQELNETVQKNAKIIALLQSEQAIYKLINDLQRKSPTQLTIFMQILENSNYEIYSFRRCAFR